jgi:hypothetical protein
MEPALLVEAMACAVRTDTDDGSSPGCAFLADLVDAYRDETKGFLLGEAEKINLLANHARAVAGKGPEAVSDAIAKIEQMVCAWVRVAEPVQLSYKDRGMDEPLSYELAGNIRQLGIDLFRNQGLLEQAQRITDLLQQWFAQVRAVADQVGEDVQAIQTISEGLRKAAEDRAEMERQITWQTEVGLLFKTRLAISPAGVEWEGRTLPLENITRARWGGVTKSVNGVPTGTSYTIGLGDNRQEKMVIQMKDGKKFEEFIGRLWRAVGLRLMGEMLNLLRSGERLRFGEAVFSDAGVTLTKHKFIGANDEIFCNWSQVQVWSANGSFVIGLQSDKKTYASLSYIYIANVHFLEHVVRLAFKGGKNTLSALLD